MKRWVRYPGPGEFRGKGEWMPLEEITLGSQAVAEGWTHDKYFEYCKNTGWLPVHEGDEKPAVTD